METVFMIAFIYLAVWTGYLAIFSLAGSFYRSPKKVLKNRENTYLILIPAYKEDAVILDTVVANLRQVFNYRRYKLVVIADQLKKQTIAQIEAMRVEVVEVNFEKSTKAKSINYALDKLNTSIFSHVVILDADNEMEPDFLSQVDEVMDDNIIAMQAHRTAKNTNSTTALLDAMNEEIGNHIFRKGHRALGLSAALIGSGMVFQLEKYKRLMAQINDTAGEDKMLEFALLDEKIKVHYANDVVVYDEKVGNSEQFSGQRTRWVTARLYFLKHHAAVAFRKLLKGDFDYFNKWLQFLLPQKILLIGYTVAFWILSQITQTFQFESTLLLGVLTAAFVIAIPRSFYSRQFAGAVLSAPILMGKILLVVIKAPFADPSKFVVTAKGKTANG